jgi:hypothetical protein
MTVSNGINYRETYVEYPELTKIHGEPNSESLYRLRSELKANAQSVYSNLSNGAHGHLALVLTDAQYPLITDTPFVRPVHPGPLVVPPATTAPTIAALKDAHNEQLRLFREVQGVEKALIQQIVKGVESPYLAAFQNRNSNSLRGTINEIIEHLQTVYGRVSPQMLENREQELRTMVLYNPKYPFDMVFNAVEDFVDYAELGHQPITPRQIIARAYTILNKTGRFKTAITKWNRKTELQKTWVAFKEHFQRAHQEFRETTNVTLEESELQHNNANLVQQVVDGIQSAMTPGDYHDDESATIMQQMANSVTHNSETQHQLAAQPSSKHKSPANPTNTPSPPFQPRGGRGRGRGGHIDNNGRGSHFRQRNTLIYCWTHGGCGHLSSTCFTKLPGHQDTATFEKKMGCNTNNCPT